MLVEVTIYVAQLSQQRDVSDPSLFRIGD